MLINRAWRQLTPRADPFPWLATLPGQLMDIEVVRQLADEFPAGSFERKGSGPASDKTYRNYSRELVSRDRQQLDGLSPLWRELVSELLADGYRHAVAELLELPVADALEVRLVRHTRGDWLGPHTDRADKAFSHILYLNPDWRARWGGCLEVLGSSDPDDVVDTVVPELGASALMVRSDHSWHQVGRVAGGSVRERTSLLVHGLCRP
jgi:SM-20-related protein